MRRLNCSSKRGQIWVETVIYTLIGLAVIGLVMAVALPKINAKKDEIIIEQSIEALGNIDDKIYEVQRAAGNRRVVDLEIRKGSLIINMEEDSIAWVLDSSFPYSEVGVSIPLGRISVTTSVGNPWEVELKMNYSMDLQFDRDNVGTKQLNSAPTPYKFIIENNGRSDGNIIIDLSEA
jgi:type II secretory pathway pseudopilin PulG